MPRPRQYTRRGSTRSRPRPQYLWENANESRVTIVPTGSSVTNLMPTDEGAPINNRGLTVVRLQGNYSVEPGAFGSDTALRYSGGFKVVTAQAFATSGAIPNPAIANPAWAWNRTDAWRFDSVDLARTSRETFVRKGNMNLPVPGINNLFMFILRNLGSIDINVTINFRVLYRLP